jgi:hypothetical protein
MSVACLKDRSNFGIWHPLWFPKVIVDGVEDRERVEQFAHPQDSSSHHPSSSPLDPLRTDLEHPYGNDGLVPVSSARWGEFLGVIENCDHWEIRGAGGLRNLSLNFDFNLNLNLGEAMSWVEWRKESGAKAKADKERVVKSLEDAGREIKRRRRDVKDEKEERDVKALTDRLSAVVDWIVDRPNGSSSPSSSSAGKEKERSGISSAAEVKKKVEEKKLDLERFYVALCRKLYDEGL